MVTLDMMQNDDYIALDRVRSYAVCYCKGDNIAVVPYQATTVVDVLKQALVGMFANCPESIISVHEISRGGNRKTMEV